MTKMPNGWLASEPGDKMASFRVVLATITLVAHLPRLLFLIREYLASEFHSPLLAGLPEPRGWAFWSVFAALQAAAAAALLVGWRPRSSAAVLTLGGGYLLALEEQHFSHNLWFHLTLLAILSFSPPTLPLRRLLAESKGTPYPVWPRRLVCIQVGILFFYGALDKVLSPFWGVDGALLGDMPRYFRISSPGFPFSEVQALVFGLMHAAPGAFSLATIVLELLIAVGFFCSWRITVPAALGFAALLEFQLSPGLFPWDVAAATLLLLPAGRERITIAEPGGARATRVTRLLSGLDWLDRLRWPAETPEVAAGSRLRLVTAAGETLEGLAAWRHLPWPLFAPLLAVLAAVNFGAIRLLGFEFGSTLVWTAAAAYGVLWLPGAAALFDRAARGGPR